MLHNSCVTFRLKIVNFKVHEIFEIFTTYVMVHTYNYNTRTIHWFNIL